MNKLDELYTKEQCEEAVKKSFSIAGMLNVFNNSLLV